jgi:4-hydroxybenzoate polyprenyltransferase
MSMRVIFNMLRVPNLLILALTFLFLRYFVFLPVYSQYSMLPMENLWYSILIISTMLIAAAGYIANDYFDVATDRINKPGKLYIGKQISAGSAFATAISLSALAAILAVALSFMMKSGLPAILLLIALAVAWWYALRLKKSFLWGNVAVSCMSAGTIAMAWLLEKQCSQFPDEASVKITSIIGAISIFAFLLSLLREIVKDIEDIEGDKLIRCKSLPIVMGIPFARTILFILSAITFILLVIAQIWLLNAGKIIAATWLLAAVEVPMVFFLTRLRKAAVKADFHALSSLLKWMMLGGILSIVACL